MYTLGIDLHKNFAFWSLLDPDGSVLWQKKLETNLDLAKEEAQKLPKPCQAVLEPTGCFSLYAERLKEAGVDPHLAHPLEVKLIAKSKSKNDKIDATILAQLLRSNFLPEAYLPSKDIKELRSFIQFRSKIVSTKTRAKTRMRMLLNSLNIKTDITDLFGVKGIKFLEALNLSPLMAIQRDELIRTVNTCNGQLKTINAVILELAEKDDDIQRIMTIPTIGPVVATVIKAYVADFKRFPNADKLASYAGLVPSVRQSGDKEAHGHITKQGPGMLRWALVQSAAIVRPSHGDLYKFYNKKKVKIGVKKARIALAKKLLTISYRVVIDKTEYIDMSKKEMDKTC